MPRATTKLSMPEGARSGGEWKGSTSTCLEDTALLIMKLSPTPTSTSTRMIEPSSA